MIRPYKEKIDKLESELKEKQKEIDKLKLKLFQNNTVNKNKQQFNNTVNKNKQQFMNNIGNQINNNQFNNMNQINNNMNQMNKMNNMGIQMNMMNDSFNLMNNQMNQNNMMTISNIPINNNIINNPMFQMCNLMNNNNNSFPMMQTGNNINKEEIKNLTVFFRFKDGAPIMIQCQSNEKMEEVIGKFCLKSGINNKNKYNFIYNAKKVILNYTVEENGIINKSNIFVIEKSKDEIAKEKEINNNNQNINNKSSVLEPGWLLIFQNKNNIGSDITIKIDEQKLVKEAINKFLLSLDIPNSTQRRFKFIFNNKELFPEMKICQSGLNNGSKILVIDYSNIIGA